LTIEELSGLAGVSLRTVSVIERELGGASVYTIDMLAKALDTTIGYLLYETDEKERPPALALPNGLQGIL
jgi:transcriptional regulator with XRE-family HTH domain